MKHVSFVACALVCLASSVVLANGPTGLGDLKLGMTKAQVEAIGHESSVYLAAPLVRYENEHAEPIAGVDTFTTTVQSPIDASPLRGTLVFKAGQLFAIHVYFDKNAHLLESTKAMISAKYGEPKVTDTMAEEQCFNRNGTNYKIRNGKTKYSWGETTPDSGYVETSLINDILDSCVMTKYAGGAVASTQLVIIRQAHAPVASPNPF